MRRKIVFIINLIQDINILRPLVTIASRDLRQETLFLVTTAFIKRDKEGIWQEELNQIAAKNDTTIYFFEDGLEALKRLEGSKGLLIAASESHLNAHKPVYDFFRMAPSSFVKITLQHGFECVGFLQSHDQNLAHGENITFAADIICGWCDEERLTSIAGSQLSKLYVTGPTMVLQTNSKRDPKNSLGMGLVCENMHSPRLNVAGNFKVDFLSMFDAFCATLKKEGQKVVLRPHPGGQYVLKNNVPLPENVVLSNAPIYKTDLTQYAYGISAPSSILIDMILAGIPVAVWGDTGSVMDLGNYEGLTRISTLNEWLAFAKEAVENPERFIERQELFLKKQLMLTRPEEVYKRYTSLLNTSVEPTVPQRHPKPKPERVLYIANAFIPTLQLSFIKPLAPLVDSGAIVTDLITEEQMKHQIWKRDGYTSVVEWLKDRIETFKPSIVVFCRYSGPHAALLLELANNLNAASIYHIDDDLLHIPEDIGTKKQQYHNHPDRLRSVRYLLDHVHLVYCSTQKLKGRLIELSVKRPIFAGKIYCSGNIINTVEKKQVKKVGYMASADHAHNLQMILAAIVRFMRRNPEVNFEFFGSISIPDELKEFMERVNIAPKIDNYEKFLQCFAEYKWDIGICPLTPIHFNLMKANTKWVEYTSVGAAVVASRGTVYDEGSTDGCGMLADTEDEWLEALEKLTRDPEERYRQVSNAQIKLLSEYSVERLREQVLDVFLYAKKLIKE